MPVFSCNDGLMGVYVYDFVCENVCLYFFLSLCLSVCMSVCKYEYVCEVCVCVCVRVFVGMYVYTHIHINIQYYILMYNNLYILFRYCFLIKLNIYTYLWWYNFFWGIPSPWFCNKGCGMCYSVCMIVHIKDLLRIRTSSPFSGSNGFPLSFTICQKPYNHK